MDKTGTGFMHLRIKFPRFTDAKSRKHFYRSTDKKIDIGC